MGLGLTSAVGSTYNFMPGVFRELQRLAAAGNTEEAAALQERLTSLFRSVFTVAGGVSVLKPMMGLLTGLELGPPRPPYTGSSHNH